MLVQCQGCAATISDAADRCPKCSIEPEQFLGPSRPCAECGEAYRSAWPACRACGAPRQVASTHDRRVQDEQSALDDDEVQPASAERYGEMDPQTPLGDDEVDQEELAPATYRQPAKKGGTLWGAVIGVGAVLIAVATFVFPKIVAVGSGYVVGSSIRTATDTSRNATEADLARQLQALETSPAFGDFYREFRTSFPAEYRQFLADMTAQMRRSKDQEANGLYAQKWVRDFVTKNMSAIATAADEPLATLALQTAKVGEILERESVPMCAGFTITGDIGLPENLSQQAQAEMGRLSFLTLRAIVSGQNSSTRRAEPTDAQSEELWEAIFATQLDQHLVDAVADGSIVSLPAAEQCAAGVATNRAIADLPPAQRAYWTALGAAEIASDPAQ